MNQLRSRAGLRLLVLILALLAAAFVIAACAPAAPTAAPAAATAPPVVAAPTQASAPAPTAATGGEAVAKADIPVGVDADGNFYRGNPKAAVKLVEYSDFQ
jgi:protein-disulfide isomerase